MTTEVLTQPVETRPLEPTTPIRPSEAIRLGCLIAPVQAFGEYGAGPKACVLGAMTIGLGAANYGYALGGDGNAWEWANAIDALRCPACRLDESPPPRLSQRLGAHLNDDHRWSRERIADWLAAQGL